MSLDPAAVGLTTAPHELEYDFRTVVLYALGIGAKADELDYLYEGRGPKVYPTFAVVPAYAPILALLGQTGGNLATMVHGAQTVTVEKPIPPAGRFVTTARVTGVYDMKRLAQMLCATESRIDGEVICRTNSRRISSADVAGRPVTLATIGGAASRITSLPKQTAIPAAADAISGE